jgi:hypothetical protein
MKQVIKSLDELASKRKRNEGATRLVAVAVDETHHWAEEIQKKAKGPILGLYLVDLTEPTHLCSLDYAYPAYFIQNHFTDVSAWRGEDGEWLDGGEDELAELESNGGDEHVTYFNRRSAYVVLKEVKLSDKAYKKELDWEDDDHQKWIDSYLEHYHGNSLL